MATATGALAAWIGIAVNTGRSTLAAVCSVLCLFTAVVSIRIAWSVIDTLKVDPPTPVSEEDN